MAANERSAQRVGGVSFLLASGLKNWMSDVSRAPYCVPCKPWVYVACDVRSAVGL